MWQFAPNSVHYLLSLWQRMVASIPYVRASEPHHLGTYTPEVTKAYITSRVDSTRIIIRFVIYRFNNAFISFVYRCSKYLFKLSLIAFMLQGWFRRPSR